MAYGNGCVFLDQHHGSRFTNYQASSDNNCFLSGAVDSVVIQNLHAGLRCAGRETYVLAGEYAGHGTIGHAVYIFCRIQSILDHRLIQMFRKRTEQKNAMDLRIFVHFVDHRKEFFLRNVSRKKDFLTGNAQSLTTFGCSSLIRDIALILTYTDDAESGVYTFPLKLSNLSFDLFI